MIRTLRVSNFRSLGPDVTVELGSFTALVGANGSGKSSVLDALQFVADAMHLGLEGAVTHRTGIGAIRRFQETGHPYDVSVGVSVTTEEIDASYSFTLKGDRAEEYRVGRERADIVDRRTQARTSFEARNGAWHEPPPDVRPHVGPTTLALPLLAGDERFLRLGDALRRIAVYAIFPDALRNPQKYDPAKPMHRHGGNWVSVLKDQPAETWKEDLVTVLHRLTGDIDDIRVQPVGGFLSAQFRHGQSARGRRQRWFDAAQESDGTLRVAGIVTALLQRPRPSLVAIEEPELTVHPGALEVVLDYMREVASDGQVVFTTHSPDVLDQIDADDVRVVERTDGVTRVARIDDAQKTVIRTGLLTLGEVLRTEGLQTELRYE